MRFFTFSVFNKIAILPLILLFSKNAFSEYAFTAMEAMSIPPFCRGLPIDNFQTEAWELKTNVAVPGKDTHHFCHGMKYIVQKNYKAAIGEFTYVETHTTPKNNVVYPANTLYKGFAYENLRETKAALTYYHKAIQYNKKFTRAYSMLASYLMKLGKREEAIAIIEQGLAASPKSKSLKKKLNKLKKNTKQD